MFEITSFFIFYNYNIILINKQYILINNEKIFGQNKRSTEIRIRIVGGHETISLGN